MNNEKLYAKCDVCGNDVLIDSFGNGEKCDVCGWRQSEESYEHPNIAGIRNIPTLNNAIKQFKAGNSAVLANFEDFVSALENYGELEFTYSNIRYGVLFDDDSKKIILLNITNNDKPFFSDISDFADNAHIDGKILKEIWSKVTNTDFLQDTK